MKNQKNIYLDYAASTPLDDRVREAMMPYLTKYWGNSAGLHNFSVKMKDALENSRQLFASACGARPSEIIFTSSATEANNLALKGVAFANVKKGRHIILSSVEHASVYETAMSLKKSGFEISSIDVDKTGVIQLESLRNLLRDDTVLVSVQAVNNELGSIQPLNEIGKICKETGVYFHTDAVQGFGKYALNVDTDKLDLFSASAHKIYGPLGAGLLYVKNGIEIEPQVHGGGQEENRRSSTVNVPAIVGFAEAFKICQSERDVELKRIERLKSKFVKQLESEIPNIQINSGREEGSPYIINVSFTGCDAELLAMQLDRNGIAVSTGSACASGVIHSSRILQACRMDKRRLNSAIRFSFGRFTTSNELDTVIKRLPDIVKKVRKVS